MFVLTSLLLIVRIIMVRLPGIFNFRQFELFDPSIYGSASALQGSLGDLLINALLFCWIIVYAGSKTKNKEPLLDIKNNAQKWIIGIISVLILVTATFFLSSIVRSLVSDSKISFDVTDFDSIKNIYSVIGFIVLASLSLAYYYLTQILFRIIFYAFANQQPFMIYFIMTLAGLFLLTFKFGNVSVLFYLPALGWLLLYTWIVQKQGVIFSRFGINIAGILFWIFIFSLSISMIMLFENKQVEWERRKSYAEKLADQVDPTSVRLLNIVLQYLDNDFLSENFYRLSDADKGQRIRDSILNINYKGFSNNFETKLYLFDANGKSLHNGDGLDYESLNLIYTQQSDTTTVPDLKYHEIAYDKFNYLIKKIIKDDAGKLLGTLFIISDPKKYGSDALLPELFKTSIKTDPENSPIYSVAIYKDKKLITASNKYQFAYFLKDDELSNMAYKKVKRGEFDELWFRADANKVVVITRKRESSIEAISLFSYLFCAFLFLVSIVQIISFILTTQLKWKKIREKFQLDIRTQIHSTVIFVSLLSFVIIGFATISFFKERYLLNNSDKLSRTMRIMVNEMQKRQADLSMFDDVIKVYDSVSLHKLQSLVEDISDIHDIDVNVYDMNGNLQVSSQANVYTKGVLSRKMHPLAFFELDKMRLIHFVQEERISNLNYLSIYAPVRDDKGRVYAYLNIPYFALQRELNQEFPTSLLQLLI